MRLAGKRAIITGAASGIGRAGVELFAREGASVAALDINKAALDEMVGDLSRLSQGKVFGIRADLASREDCRTGIQQAIEKLGGIDILWLHAGTAVFGDFDGLNLDLYDQMTNLNVTGPIISIGTALPHFRAQGNGGSIVLTASISGLVGSLTSPIYSTHKFALVGMAKSLSQSLGKDGIRVNAVCPGHIRTPALISFITKARGEEGLEAGIAAVAVNTALGRVGESRDIAHAALWLASDDAAYVTGVALPVDGGYTAR